MSLVARAASRTLYVPMMFTRMVWTGIRFTVSTPAIAPQWTMWVAPCDSSRTASGVEDVRLVEGEVGMLEQIELLGERVAVQVVERDDLVGVDEAARERPSR